MLLVVGMPLLLLELALGQKLRVGAARAWYKVGDKIADVLDPVKTTFEDFHGKCSSKSLSLIGAPRPWRDWLWFHSGGRPGRLLLQCHHRLVHLLPLVLHECEWGAILKHLNKSASAQRVA